MCFTSLTYFICSTQQINTNIQVATEGRQHVELHQMTSLWSDAVSICCASLSSALNTVQLKVGQCLPTPDTKQAEVKGAKAELCLEDDKNTIKVSRQCLYAKLS